MSATEYFLSNKGLPVWGVTPSLETMLRRDMAGLVKLFGIAAGWRYYGSALGDPERLFG